MFRFSVLLLLFPLANCAGSFKCNRTAFESCITQMVMVGDESFVYPSSLEDMNKRCRNLKTLDRCTKEYAQNCLSGESRNSINVILYGVSKRNNGYCTRKGRKAEMASFGKCLNTHKKAMQPGIEAINRRLHGIQVYPDKKMHLYMTCCAYFRCKKDMLNAISSCTETEQNRFEALMDGYAADGLNLLCGDYNEDSDLCEALVKKIPKWNKPLKQKVFFLSIVDVLNNL